MHTNDKSGAYNKSLTLSPCRLCSRDECKFPLTCQEDPWKCLLLLVQNADRNMHKHKKEDLDCYFNYGIVMFICNAVVLVDSSKWNTENASYSVIAWFCRGIRVGPHPPDTLFVSYNAAVTIAALLAMSLVLTSVSLLMCHLSRRWLRQFVNQPQFSYKNKLAFRQIHYDSLCRWGFFNLCDIIPFLLSVGATFSSAGLMVFLWQLNSPGAYVFLGISCAIFVYRIVIALHPLRCFLTTPQDGLISELSPFRSPSSWFFFKLFMNWFGFTSYWMHQNRTLLKHQRPIHSQFRPPVRFKSIDWLEQDCSLFMQRDNAPDINAPLTNTLIWVDSNPTIEKTTKVVVSVYHAISDLHLTSILPHFKERWTGSESALAGIIATAAQKCTDMNDPAVTAFVLKNWLELHVTRLPELRTQLAELQIHCMNEIGNWKRIPDYACLGINSINDFLIQGCRLPVRKVHSLLAATRTVLVNGIYYEGTFKLIFRVIFQLRDSASERQASLVFAVFTECKHFAYSFRGSRVDEQQARQFMSELGEFLSNFQAIDCNFDLASGQRSWSPLTSDIWKDIVTTANEVYLIAGFGFRDKFLASPTEPIDGTPYPVSTRESFDCIQFKSNDTGVESATNALTVWSWDAGSCPRFSDPEALVRF